jgi:hypothetical protein
MCLKVIAWAADQYFPINDQLALMVLAEQADEDGVIVFDERAKRRLLLRTRWEPDKLGQAIIRLYHRGAFSSHPSGAGEIRLEIGRRFDFRPGKWPEAIIVPLLPVRANF